MYILQEDRKKLGQAQARLQHQEILLQIKERKARISNFIRIGEMMERCKISLVDHKVLAGGFLFIQESLKNQAIMAEWGRKGEPYVQKSLRPKKKPDLLQIILRKDPPAEIRRSLWEHGFTCENTARIWEGKGIKKEIESIVAVWGTVYKMKQPNLPGTRSTNDL